MSLGKRTRGDSRIYYNTKRRYQRGMDVQASLPNIPISMGSAGVNRRMLRRMIKNNAGELKGLDTILDIAAGNLLSTTNTNGSSFVLNLIRPGSGSENRIGRKVKLSSIRIRGNMSAISASQATTGTYDCPTVRMVVVWDKQPSGTLPTYDTIFGTKIQAGTEGTQYLDPVKYDNTDRFRVLSDTIVNFNPSGQNTAGGTIDTFQYTEHVDVYINLEKKNLISVYSGESSPQTIADISSGALYVYFRSDQNTTDKSQAQFGRSFARLRYRDA